MRKKLHLMLMLAAMLLPMGLSAQVTTFPYAPDLSVNLGGWTAIDNDGDGYGWVYNQTDGGVTSASYANSVALEPDNWLVSPAITLGERAYTFRWEDWNYNASYPEHYSVYISTTGATVDDFLGGEQIHDFTFETDGTWEIVSYDLSAYAGQTIWIAFRHWNSIDQYRMGIRGINIESADCPSISGFALWGYNSDGEPVFGWNASVAFSEYSFYLDGELLGSLGDTAVSITGLEPGVQYSAYVKAPCTNGDSATSDVVTFTTPTGIACTITITAVDSYGDGWNDASLAIMQNGVQIGTLTVPNDGGSGNGGVLHEFSFDVDGGLPVEFVWTRGSYDGECSFTVTDGGGEVVYTCAQGNASNYSNGQTVFTLSGACPSCLVPQGFAVSDVTTTTALITWTAEDVLGYQLAVGDDIYSLSGSSYNLSSLEPGEVYTLGLRKVCAEGDTSGWISITFATPCEDLALPYNEDFESGEAACWLNVGGNGSVESEDDTNNYMYIGTTDIAVLNRPVAMPAMGLRVGYSQRDYGTVYYGYMTNPADASTFVQVGGNYGSSSSWTDYGFTIEGVDEGTVVYIAFRNNSGYSTLHIDNINISEFTGCKTPENVWVNSVSDTEVEIQFVGVGAVGYELALSTSGSYVDSQTVVIETTDSVIVVTGLSPNTAYYNRMRSICNGYTTGWTPSTYFYTQRSWPEVVGIYQNTIGYESASLYWSWNSAINALESWNVLWRVAGTGEWSEAMVDANTTSYVLDGLEQGEEYEFGVFPISGGEMRDGLVATFTTLSCNTRNNGDASSSNVFTNVNYRNTFSEQIVTVDDLQGLGTTLNGITFYGVDTPQDTVRTLDLYLGHTAEASFGSNSAWIPVSSLTRVAQNVSFTAGASVHIDFDTPFVRSVDSNLVVAVYDHSGFYYGTFNWSGKSTEDFRTLHLRSDNDSISLGSLLMGTRATFVGQMTFDANECQLPDYCEQPTINVVQNGQGYDITVSPVQPNIAYTIRYRAIDNNPSDWTLVADSVTLGLARLDANLVYDRYEFEVFRICGDDTLSDVYDRWYGNCGIPNINVWLDSASNYVVGLNNGDTDALHTIKYIIDGGNDTVTVGQFVGNDTMTLDLRSSNYVHFIVSRQCTNGETSNYYNWVSANCYAPTMSAWIDPSTYKYVVTWSGEANMEYTVSYAVYNNGTGQYDTVEYGQYVGSDTVMFDFRSADWINFIVSRECDNNTVFSSYWVSGNCQNPELSVNTNSSRVQLVVNNYVEGASYNVYYRRAWYDEEYILLAEGVQQDTYEVSGLAQDTYWEFHVTSMCGNSEVGNYIYSYGDCGTFDLFVNDNNYIQWENVGQNEYEISYYDNNVGDYVVLTTTTDSVFNPADFCGTNSYEFRIGRSCSGEMQYNYITASGNCYAPSVMSYEATDSSITIVWNNIDGETTVRWGLRSNSDFVQLGSSTVEAGVDSYTISGLESGGMYRIFLGRMCMDRYVESNGININTICAAPKAVPYYENFDDKERNYYVYDPCWWRGSTGTDYAPYYAIFSGNESDILLHVMNGSWAAMPVMDTPINELQVRFRYVAGGEDAEMILGLIGDADTSFDQLLVLDTIHHGDYGTEQSVWVTYRFDEVTDLTKNRIVFWGFQTEGYYSNLGEVTVETIPPCAEVGGLACTATTTDGATLTWDAAEGQFVEYIVEYGPKGFALGEGMQATSTTNSIDIAGLEPATTYDAYVKVNCGRQGLSYESSVARFTTECVAVSYIYEDFSGYTVPGATYYGLMPNCWSYDLMGIEEEAIFVPQIMSGNEQYGGKALVMSSQAVVALPEMGRPLSELMISLEMPYRNEDVDARLVLGTVAHTGEGMAATFEPLDTINVTGYYEYYLDQYTGSRTILALKNILNDSSNTRAYVVVSMLAVGDMPTCFEPQNVVAEAIDAHTATVDWTQEREGSGQWLVEYYQSDRGWIDTTVGSHPVVITNLDQNTHYTFYVYSICDDYNYVGGGEYSINTPEACPAPQNFYVSEYDAHSATLSWTYDNATQWEIAYGYDNNWQTVTVDEEPYTIDGLRSNTYYQFQIRAVCSEEEVSDWQWTDMQTQEICFAPENFRAEEVSAGQIVFAWDDSVAGTWHLRSSGGTVDVIVDEPTYTVENPIEGATYEFYLKAVCGDLDESSEVSLSVTVPCGVLQLTADESIYESFENGTPYCWQVSGTGVSGYTTGWLNRTGERGYVIGSNSTNASYRELRTRMFAADTLIAFEFWYANEYEACTFVVGYDTADATGQTNTFYTDTLTSNGTDWKVYRDTLPANAVRVVFRFFDDEGTSSQRYLGLDDVSLSVLTPLSCAAPVAVSVDEVTTNTVSLTITGNDSATATAGYAVRLTDAAGNVAEVTTETGVVTIEGLTTATSYAIAVRTLCGEVNSTWTNFGWVKTACEQVSVPHFFDLSGEADEALPFCWAYDPTAQRFNHGWWPMHKSAYRENNGVRMVGNMIVALPEVDTELQNLMLSFNLSGENNTGTVEVGVVENVLPGFDSTFTVLGTFDQSAGYVEMLLSGYTGQSRRVAFRHVAGDSSLFCSGYITDINIVYPPACMAPAGLHVVEATASSVTLDWTDDMPASAWVVNYGDGLQMEIAEHPVTIDGLDAGTTYLFEVTTLCGDEAYSSSIFASTGCNAISELPYYNGFNSDVDGALPPCWAYDPLATSENSGWLPTVYSMSNGDNYLLIVGNAVVALPEVEADMQSLMLSFDVYVGAGDQVEMVEIGVVDNNDEGFAETFVPIDTVESNSQTVMFNGYTGQGHRMAIRQSVPQGSFAYTFFDNISIQVAPTCFAPENMTVVATTETSITIDWTDRNEATEWQVVCSDNNDDYRTFSVSSHPFSIDSLMPGVRYSIYVGTVCEGEEPLYSMLNAMTDCGAITDLPIRFNFDQGTGCWENGNAGFWDNTIELYSNGYAFTPAIVVGEQQLVVEFDVEPYWNGNGNSYELYVGTYASDGENVIGEQTVVFTEAQHVQLTLGMADSARVLFYNEGGNTNYGIRNIYIHRVADCSEPTDLAALGTTSTSITLDWESDADAWELSCASADAANGNVRTVAVDAHPYTIENLHPGSDYLIKLRAVCPNGEATAWIETNASTACDVIVDLPFTYDFDNDAQGTMPACWAYDPMATTLDPANTLAGVPQVNHYSAAAGSVLNLDYSTIVALPEMAAPINTLTVDFNVVEVGGSSADAILVAGVVDNAEAGFAETFVGIDTLYFTSAGIVGHHSFDFAAYSGNGNRVAFRTVAPIDEWHYLSIDSVSISTTMTPCLAPESLTVVSVDVNEAVVDWAPAGDETAWEVRLANDTLYRVFVATEHPLTLSGLTRGTNYEVSVRALCGDAQVPGIWSDAVGFATEYCHTGVPTDVTVGDIDMTSATISWTPASADDHFWTVRLTLVDVDSLVAVYMGIDTNEVNLGGITFIEYSDSSTFTVDGMIFPNSSYLVSVATMCDPEGDHVGTWSEPVLFSTPGCPTFGEFEVGNVSDTGATISWTDGFGDEEREFVVVPAGTTINGDSIEIVYYGETYGTSVVVTGLEANTAYDFYVAAPCYYYVISNPVTFTTLRHRYTAAALVADTAMGSASVSDTMPWQGDTVVFMATAAEGYHFTAWSNGDTAATTTVVVDSDVTLTAAFAINVYSVTVSYDATRGSVADAEGAAVAAGSVFEAEHGATLHFTASALDNGSRFVNWTDGAIVTTAEAIDYTVISNATLTANFASPDSAMLTLAVNDAAMGTVSGAGMYQIGATANITASPAEHHHFIGWSNGSTEATMAVVVDSDMTLTAYFAIDTHTVLVSCDTAMGTVSGAGQYAYGTEATLVAAAAEGYRFTGWSNGDTLASISLTVVADTAFEAFFEAIVIPVDTVYYTVSVVSSNTAMGTVSTAGGVYAEGTSLTVTATPNEGYMFVAWMSDTTILATTATYTFTVDADITLTALFAQGPTPTAYVVSVEVNDPTMGYVTGDGTYNEGGVCTLEAHAYAGYRFVGWMNGNQQVSTDSVYSFTVNANITLTAVFERDNDGIDDVDMAGATVYSADSKIVVRGAADSDVHVYDVNGRLVCSEARVADGCEFRMAATGVYLVKVGDAPAKRVIVVR